MLSVPLHAIWVKNLEEAMFETGESLSAISKFDSVLEKNQSIYSVFNTLAFRAKVVSSNQYTLQQELKHIQKALLACNFPPLGPQ